MESSFQEEFKKTWLTSLIGIGLLCAGTFVLAWNEGRAVHHAHSLDEAYENVIPLNVYEPLQPEYDGRLVHIAGPLLIDEPLTEPDYGVSIQAVKLKRRVQMFQWIEEKSGLNFNSVHDEYDRSDAEYHYFTEWRDKLVDSNSFYIRHGHHNPTTMPLKTHVYVSPLVRVGQLYLGSEIKNKFTDYAEMTSDERPERRDIKLHLGIYYHCDDVWNAEVGDIRVQFYYAGHNGEPVSVIALQKDGTLVPYETSRKHQLGLVRHGILTVKQMFDAEHSDAKLETWKFRAVGLFALYASSLCLARLLAVLCLKWPRLKQVYSGDIGAASCMGLAFSVALFVVSLSWLAHRPMIGLGLLTASFSPFIYCLLSIFNPNVNAHHNR